MCGRNGFTLTEMLFVVIIAAGVLAFALPAYKGAKDRAQFQAATGMLMDLGSAVESITRDLAMQGINITVGAGTSIAFPVEDVTIDVNNHRGTIKEIYNAEPNKNTAVLGMLRPFKYLDSFTNPGGYKYYVGTGGSGGSDDACAVKVNKEEPPAVDSVIVACMRREEEDQNFADCFRGAWYFQGGRLQTIRGIACKN